MRCQDGPSQGVVDDDILYYLLLLHRETLSHSLLLLYTSVVPLKACALLIVILTCPINHAAPSPHPTSVSRSTSPGGGSAVETLDSVFGFLGAVIKLSSGQARLGGELLPPFLHFVTHTSNTPNQRTCMLR